MVTAMTIAGSDPSLGAGIGADIKTFLALGINPVSVVTCLTAQNDNDFFAISPVDHEFLTKQADSILNCYSVAALKIGLLYTKENLTAVKKLITRHNLTNVVLDPVIRSTTGTKLTEYTMAQIKNELFPYVDVLTPNLFEAERISRKVITSPDSLKEAALEIAEFGCKNIVITGFLNGDQYTDLLYDGENFVELKGKAIKAPDMHGTGCTFSSALTAMLAKGSPLSQAVKKAKDFTYNAIKHAHVVDGDLHVLNHFYMQGNDHSRLFRI